MFKQENIYCIYTYIFSIVIFKINTNIEDFLLKPISYIQKVNIVGL